MEQTDLSLKESVNSAVLAAQNIKVNNNDDYEVAGNARKELKYTLKNINAYWEPKINQAFQLHKSLVASKKEMTDPLDKADRIIDQKMGDYRREQERIRQEAERERRRIEEEARKAAEEAQRLLDEASQKDELDQEDVEILQLAQADLDKAVSVVAPVVQAPAKVQGISVRKVWRARVVDDAAVPVSVAGVCIRPIDTAALNKLAVASSGGFRCPGVEFYQEEISQVRL